MHVLQGFSIRVLVDVSILILKETENAIRVSISIIKKHITINNSDICKHQLDTSLFVKPHD